jgi:hypothetical protein
MLSNWHAGGRYTMIGTTTAFRHELETIMSAKLIRRSQHPGHAGHQYGYTWSSGSSEDEEDDAEGDQGDAEDHGAALSSDGDDEALQ